MVTIAITGSSGMIGTQLRQRLEAAGNTVVRVRRGNPSDPAALWDPESGWVRPGALAGADAVVHLAGASIGEGRWNAKRKALLRSSRIDATRLLVSHLATIEGGPRTLVAASAIGYYGNRGDDVLDESSGPGGGFLAELVVDWERETLKAKDAGIRAVPLRFGIILDREGGALPRMLMPFKFGVGGRLGSGKQWMSWVAASDVLKAIEFALNNDIEGPANVTAPNPVTNADFTRALAKVLKRPALFPAPPIALRTLIGESADELLFYSQRVQPKRLQAAGFAFEHTEITEALSAVLG